MITSPTSKRQRVRVHVAHHILIPPKQTTSVQVYHPRVAEDQDYFFDLLPTVNASNLLTDAAFHTMIVSNSTNKAIQIARNQAMRHLSSIDPDICDAVITEPTNITDDFVTCPGKLSTIPRNTPISLQIIRYKTRVHLYAPIVNTLTSIFYEFEDIFRNTSFADIPIDQ